LFSASPPVVGIAKGRIQGFGGDPNEGVFDQTRKRNTVNDFLERISKLSPNRLTLLAAELNSSLERLKRQASEPLAIIGIGCRFPGGANDPESFWRLMSEGREAISEVPPDRWDIDAFYDPNPDAPAKMSTRRGGFLSGIDRFDPEFFGISPREAAGMDPQQRLLLEVAWEALEHAGQSADLLEGSRTGVFAGLCTSDYYLMRCGAGPQSIDAYAATGNAHSVAAGRISYLLGLQGPSIAVDTSCSSSLVAVHLACQSLRLGECSMALAGGVNLILNPDITITLSKSHMMAPDGRCKAFDASADGFVRAEGCGLVVLKRLSDARADGDRVLAVIRGTASNQDGKSSGLTAPNGPSQVAVIQQALANAGLQPSDVDFIEAHGTGTSLGDPIEARALADVFGPSRAADCALQIGSVKTNIGHAESAAGIAGLIKAVLALQYGRIPPNLHFKQLNPHIDWNGLAINVPTAETSWNRAKGSRVGGVSSFGFSGTNAHVVLSDLPSEEFVRDASGQEQDAGDGPLHLLPLSARTQPALAALVREYEQAFSKEPGLNFADVCHTAGIGRCHFAHRLAVVAPSLAEAKERLAAFQRGEKQAGVQEGRATNSVPGVVFMFTGQGSQYVGMGRELFETQPVFRRELKRCAEILEPLLEKPLLEVIFPDAGEGKRSLPLIDQTQYTQPALFALEYSLAALWRSWGVEPVAVLGHSVGEYVAACVAGVFSLEDALHLVAVRARLMQKLPQNGTMAAVLAGEDQVRAAIAPYADSVSIAAINSPQNTVISGKADDVLAALESLRQDGVEAKLLTVSHAFHSPLVEPILDEFEQHARGVQHQVPVMDLVLNTTGRIVDETSPLDAAYWRRHAREAVRFAESISTLRERGMRVFLEIGPAPVLTGLARQCVGDSDVVWLASLRKDRDAWSQMLSSLSSLFVLGVNPHWQSLSGQRLRSRIALPTYPFQRRRHWMDTRRIQSQTAGQHPLLGDGIRSARGEWVFESKLSLEALPYLQDHRVHGIVVFPAPAYLEMAMACGQRAFAGQVCAVTDFVILEPLVLPEAGELTVQLIAVPCGDGALSFEIFSCEKRIAGSEPVWTLHGRGRLAPPDRAATANPTALDEVRKRCAQQVSSAAYYEKLRALNIAFGPCFRGIREISRRDGEALGRLEAPELVAVEANRYYVHPALLDACFQLLGAAIPGDEDRAGADSYLLVGLKRIVIAHPPSAAAFWTHCVLHPSDGDQREELVGDMQLVNDDGGVFGFVEGVRLKRATREALIHSSRRRSDDWLYEVRWVPKNELGCDPLALPARFMPASDALRAAVQGTAADLWQRHRLATYGEAMRGLEAASLDLVIRALTKLGWKPRPGERVSASALAARLGIARAHWRLVGRLLELLGEQRILARDGEEWIVLSAPTSGDPEARIKALVQAFPQYAGEISMLTECGTRLAEVFAGTCDPLAILFPGGSMTEVEKLTRDSPAAQTFNELVARVIQAALAKLPKDRVARVIEVGAGTGGTTTAVLARLPDAQVEYVFTDVSQHFLAKAQQKFLGRERTRFAILDVEKTPGSQGFEEHSFDVVLAANVLHATKNLRETLSNVRRLLAPGGLLVLFEVTSAQTWVDLTFGLTEGWWRFEDNDLRTSHPLLSRQSWTSLLEASGFTDVSLLPEGIGSDLPGLPTVVLCKNAPESAAIDRGTWLLLSGSEKAAEPWRAALEARGEQVQIATAQEGSCDVESVSQAYRSLLHRTRAAGLPVKGIVHLVGTEGPPLSDEVELSTLEASVRRSCLSALSMFRALISDSATESSRIWLITRAGLPTAGSLSALDQSPMWGLGRTFAVEHPELWGGLIDIAELSTQSVATAVDQLLSPAGEDQLAVVGGEVLAGRLMRCAKSIEVKTDRAVFHADASYLVTGGFGGMGRRVLDWMAEQGARHIAVIGRSVDPANPDEAVAALGARGVQVLSMRADVADDAALGRVFEEIGARLPKLAGVIHVAGIFDDRVLARHDWPRFERVLKPKVAGGWNLHQRTKNLKLDFFVLFSSAASFLAPVGLGNYSAGNAFLDALAHHRRAQGLPAVSIDWGAWEKVGMAQAVGDRRESQWSQGGAATMTPQQGLAVLERLIRAAPPQVGVLIVDWPKYLKRFGSVTPPLYAELRLAMERVNRSASPAAAPQPEVELVERLGHAAPAERRRLVQAFVREHVTKVLALDPSQLIDNDQSLNELGLDSLMALELRNVLGAGVKRTLPTTLVFDQPSIDALTQYISADVLDLDEASPRAAQGRLDVAGSIALTNAEGARDKRTTLATVTTDIEEGQL
jgi:acyl transferase domain-containing protein/acyl carrier protein